MTPKEKAIEVYFKMLKWQDESNLYIERNVINTAAKQCALITVNEILKDRERLCDAFFYDGDYWLKVKKQIEKL